MPKQIIIAEQHRIASVFAEEQIQELIVATGTHQVSDIYLGVVENILPSIDAAFVNLGDTERNGFIHVSDLGPLKLRRTSGAITELLVPQQKVLVQIMKEPTGNKGPRLTGNISLPGRYLVLMPYGRGVNLSRRIVQEDERSRLRALGILIKPAGMGLLVRTEAEGVSEDAIIEDLELLQSQWEAIQQQAASSRAPSLLDRDSDFIQRVLRDAYNSDVNSIVVDSESGLNRVKKYLMNWNSNRLPQGILVDQHREKSSILEHFRVNAAIREALKPRVDLPSGGYIIIERTEALTVIDVNSGSFTRSATARETVLWTNCEAASEIARQLRLRNIAGVIIVDFIDMDSRRDQLQVLERFNKALKADKSRPQIAQLTELGLIELTRKRQGQNIYELFGRPCPSCGGLGHLAHLPGDPEDSPGEMVERPLPSRSFSVPTNYPAPRATGGFENIANLQELNLINHPSYQEQTSRKRRHRTRLGATLSSDLGPPKLVRKQSKLASGSHADSNADSISNNAVPTQNPIIAAHHAEPDGKPVRERQTDGRRRSRRDSSQPIPALPPEIVSVEMSDQEQHVYAFMGISPLVKYAGSVNNPKTAIVKILSPGETAPAEESRSSQPNRNSEEDSGENSGERPLIPEETPAKNAPILIKTSRAISKTVTRKDSLPEVPATEDDLTEQAEHQQILDLDAPAEKQQPTKVRRSRSQAPESVADEAESASTLTRRRRRRSSAAQQLSLETTS